MRQRLGVVFSFGLFGLGLACSGCSDAASPDPSCMPSRPERCGGGDENCDGAIDEPGAEGCVDYLQDRDGDGVPDGEETRCLCAPEPPWTLEAAAHACGVCDDGDPCTLGVCDLESRHCRFEPHTGPCDDGDPCTVGTVCVEGACGGGEEVVCDDGDLCTESRCLPGYGCTHIAVIGRPCDDGDPCTIDDMCQEGGCAGFEQPNCGEPYCGDEICGEDEDCLSCPRDCSPLGFGRCGAACDPITTARCDDGGLCVPGGTGAARADVLGYGNGLCGQGCATDADCEGGICALAPALQGVGVCLPPCEVGGTCEASGGECLASAEDPTRLGCALGPRCDPRAEEPCGEWARCTLVGGEPRCVEGCAVGDPSACEGGGCAPLGGDVFRVGTCLTEVAGCVPLTGEGCGAGEVCAWPNDPFARGRGYPFCQPLEEEVELGARCGSALGACGLGRICVASTCRAVCPPGPGQGSGCGAREACVDVADIFDGIRGVTGYCQPGCGDGACGTGESCLTCPEDCGPCSELCGDGICDPRTETCGNCPQDCGACEGCGDGVCGPEEDCERCPEDCGTCPCGDGICQDVESCEDCPQDCGACEGPCGNGFCERVESCASCPADCGPCPEVCGDGICAHPVETCRNCPGDCPDCADVCGDGLCGETETCLTCPADCESFSPGLRCGPSCDFTAPSCPGNARCFPSGDGYDGLDRKVIEIGDGVCGAGCDAGRPCPDGACVGVLGLAEEAICLAGGAACDVLTGEGCGLEAFCLPRRESPEQGVCVPGCRTDDDASCGGVQAHCRKGLWAWWRDGRCLGADPCDMARQTGCAAGETCAPMMIAPGQPIMFGCHPGQGGETEGPGGACGDDGLFCLPGLACDEGTCRSFCAPGTCPAGQTCEDIDPDFDLLTVVRDGVGLCR